MIAYHGGPFSDAMIAAEVWRKHHAMVSFAHPEQIDIAAEHASTFALDSGAFPLWKAGQVRPDWSSYYRWIETRRTHPAFDFAIIPDVIDGCEEENDALLAEYPFLDGVPVYHLHEPRERLVRLAGLFENRARVERPLRQHMHAPMVGPHARDSGPPLRRNREAVREAPWSPDACARDPRARAAVVSRFGHGRAKHQSGLQVERDLRPEEASSSRGAFAGPD